VRVIKLAPPRRLFPLRPYPHNRSSLLQYIFPKPLRDRYRDRLFNFHLDTLPSVKHRLQSRIYSFILERQRRRREQSRLVDRARRLLTGHQLQQQQQQRDAGTAKHGQFPRYPIPTFASSAAAAKSAYNKKHKKHIKNSSSNSSGIMTSSMPGYGVGGRSYGEDAGATPGVGGREPGSRRRKLAAMAGSVYRAGASAASEIRESYNQTRSREIDHPDTSKITIPGSFPDVAIITKGDEQMVLFPSYAKRHVRNEERQFEVPGGSPETAAVDMNEQEYWRQEWSRHEDEKAVVDVDIRGWIYNPHRGPITRRNRMLIGLARQLSGIPVPSLQQGNSPPGGTPSWHLEHEEMRDQERIAMRAKEIERQGKEEQAAALKGGYSERPSDPSIDDVEEARQERLLRTSGGATPIGSRSGSPSRSSLKRTNTSNELSDEELAVANANLMARIAPFMTLPMVEIPITLFFYNDSQSQSRTITTNDSGHFMTRAALDFVPTHVKVMANENISCVEPVQIIEPKGVSLISDIDDTIKRSNISLGAKEIFRNTFIRELHNAAVDGVKEWYTSMYDMGVKVHYCSNSPWQLYPVLATFFKLAGLPPGSLHLKAYSGMLQGIFEPVAERKKGTLERIMKDFPERRFILVGDSGEADLEVYTELAVANPKRILGIFIRDVTTPEKRGYFDSAFAMGDRGSAHKNTAGCDEPRRQSDEPSSRPTLPPRVNSISKAQQKVEEDLIDFSEEPASKSAKTEAAGKKAPPQRPTKPKALQGAPSAREENGSTSLKPTPGQSPQPPPARRSTSQQTSQTAGPQVSRHDSFESATASTAPRKNSAPAPPPPRRRGTPLSHENGNQQQHDSRRGSASTMSTSTTSSSTNPEARVGAPTHQLQYTSQQQQNNQPQAPVDRKVDLWQARVQRAHSSLDEIGVPLYTWRRGKDVTDVTEAMIKRALKELGVEPGKSRKG